MRPEDFIADRCRPFTGAEYMESLRDGRDVYFDGERVSDLTTHPAFRNSVRSIARLYDALHDPETRDLLTCPTDTGSGGYTHKYFRVARSRDDMRGAQQAIAGWARLTYGWMGRTPDYKAAFSNTLGAFPEYYGALRRQRAELVQARARGHAVHEPRDRQSADRSSPTARRGQGCLRLREEGNRRGHICIGCQGSRDLGGDDALQLHGPVVEDRHRGSGPVGDVHGAD